MTGRAFRARILDALAGVLEPLILLLLKSGVTWREFSEVAKGSFVKVATKNFGIRTRPTNASRVAILTGIDRREVSRLRKDSRNRATLDTGFMSKPTQVLDAWFHNQDFVGANGKPKDLHLSEGEDSFAALIRRYAPGIPPVAMVKELRAAGAIELTNDQHVRVLARQYIPRELSENQIRLWGSALQDVGTTLEHNLMRARVKPSRFERRALNLSIDVRKVPAFEAFLAQEGQAFLNRVDDWLAAHQLQSEGSGATGVRLGVGVYEIRDAG
jgi:hypothetical protein